jgi:hypothetical protein
MRSDREGAYANAHHRLSHLRGETTFSPSSEESGTCDGGDSSEGMHSVRSVVGEAFSASFQGGRSATKALIASIRKLIDLNFFQRLTSLVSATRG